MATQTVEDAQRLVNAFLSQRLKEGLEQIRTCSFCGNAFIKKRSDNELYCSRECSSQSTSRLSKEGIKTRKLAHARSALTKWKKLPPHKRPGDWKAWAITLHPELTHSFITRHINLGSLPQS